MASTTKTEAKPTIDGKAILTKLAAGFQTKATKRGGKPGFTLIQKEDRTIAMASIRKDGAIKLEGSRIGKTLRVETASEIASARKVMEGVVKANAAKKASGPTAADARSAETAVTKARVAAASSGGRARTRQHARVGVQVES
ncbi:MAG: hypothetical protein ACRDKU_10045 [Gaiellaceae bacterium]